MLSSLNYLEQGTSPGLSSNFTKYNNMMIFTPGGVHILMMSNTHFALRTSEFQEVPNVYERYFHCSAGTKSYSLSCCPFFWSVCNHLSEPYIIVRSHEVSPPCIWIILVQPRVCALDFKANQRFVQPSHSRSSSRSRWLSCIETTRFSLKDLFIHRLWCCEQSTMTVWFEQLKTTDWLSCWGLLTGNVSLSFRIVVKWMINEDK